MISYVIPTRDRPGRLRETLLRIGALGDHAACGGAEVVIVDNDSAERLVLPPRLASGVRVREVLLRENAGAAARNRGVLASDPASTWIVMLDDDSFPRDLRIADVLREQPADVAAVSADISLPGGVRESGGLPEVFVGCGVAIRRDVFVRLGGYDAAFGYYAEEYDLAARMLLAGYRVAFDGRFRVRHEKATSGRDMDVILSRLVRNSGWVAQRYAPDAERAGEVREVRRRYRAIAGKERALAGFGSGLTELRRTIRDQRRTPMRSDLWDRFTGLSYARMAIGAAHAAKPFDSAAIVDPGKNAWVVARVLSELGVRVAGDGEDAGALVIGTMSPGPMLDALARRGKWVGPHSPRVIAPWAVTPVRVATRRIAA